MTYHSDAYGNASCLFNLALCASESGIGRERNLRFFTIGTCFFAETIWGLVSARTNNSKLIKCQFRFSIIPYRWVIVVVMLQIVGSRIIFAFVWVKGTTLA